MTLSKLHSNPYQTEKWEAEKSMQKSKNMGKAKDWRNQYPLNTLKGTSKLEFIEFIEGLLKLKGIKE